MGKESVELNTFEWYQLLTELESSMHVYGGLYDNHSPHACKDLYLKISSQLAGMPVVLVPRITKFKC